jgi:hypothetical protein
MLAVSTTCVGWGLGCRFGNDQRSQFRMRSPNSVESDHVESWWGHERYQLFDQFFAGKHDCGGAIRPRAFELQGKSVVVYLLEALVRD